MTATSWARMSCPPSGTLTIWMSKLMRKLSKSFHKALNVQLIPKTEIVEVRFRSQDPKLAADVANAIANTYIEHNFQTKYKATLQTSDWLTKQLDDLKTRAQSAQETLTAYQKKTGILGYG